ncbi:zinc finger protein 431-like [Belonocnema kinseyi]|uniref:zinc finger protein 431-like n=1 Tax=Belonocnema kinseyi TaxID=2817044 RepID=UPI00143D5B03|nr:zinc finger protein 431-like [Belonocnema kinseyi]
MNISMRDSSGELIEILIKDANACKRMQLENGIKNNFANPPEANQTLYNIISSLSGIDEGKLVLDNEDSNASQVDFLELSNLETLPDDGVTITEFVNNLDNNDNNYLKEYLHSNNIEIMEEYQFLDGKELDDKIETSEKLIVTNDISSPLCRLCARQSDEMFFIFGLLPKETSIAEKINNYLPIKVEKTDTFPKKICLPCLEKLDLIDNFHKTVSESEANFLKTKKKISGKKTEPLVEKRPPKSLISASPAKKSFETEALDPENLYDKVLNEDDFEMIEESEEENAVQEDDSVGPKNLSKNLEKDHSNEASEVSSSTIEPIKCRVCEAKFYTMRKCYLHSASHSSSNYYPCSLCDTDSPSPEKWREHFTEHSPSKLHDERILNYECEICQKKHVSEARLKFHLQFHEAGVKARYCQKCDKFLASESVLYNHYVMVHMKLRDFCCDICGSVFRSQPQLDVHQRKHKNERPYECQFCSKRFLSMDSLRRHRKLHLPDKLFQCKQCGKRFNRANSLTNHLLTHQVEAKQSMICQFCDACNEVFLDVSEAESHIQVCKSSDSPKIEEKSLNAIYRCEFCQRCFTSIKFAKTHRKSHSGPTPFICTICNVAYATYNQVQAHKSAHRKSSQNLRSKETTITKFFFCEYCEKEFLQFTNMNVHRKSCVKTKNWTCGCCSAVFPNNFELSKHKRRRDPGEDWSCDYCDKSFANFCGLITHKDLHTRTNKNLLFACSICGKNFHQKAHLTIHTRSHTGEKPYACDLCDKAYSIKCDRDNHRRTHTGERPFKCTICEKAFKNPARLREHMLNHSDIRPYKCDICEQAFKKGSAKKVHMLIHTGEKPFQCDICGLHFRRSGDMKKHKISRHEPKPQADKTEVTD